MRDIFVPAHHEILAQHINTRRRMPLGSSVSFEGPRVGFTNGCFEIMHPGHVEYLMQAAALCDFLIVGINSDSSMARIKRKPVVRDEARALVVNGIKGVEYTVIFDEDNPVELLKILKPDIYIKGGDYAEKPYGFTMHAAKDMGCDIQFTEFVEGQSSTRLLEKIRETG